MTDRRPEVADLPALRLRLITLRDEAIAALADLDRLLADTAVPSDLLSPREVATRLGLGLTTVYTLMDRGELPSTRIGTTRRIARSAVEAIQRAASRDHGLVSLPPPTATRASAHSRRADRLA